VITYNVLTAMKRLVLPPDLQTARPKASTVFDLPAAGQADPTRPQDGVAADQDWNRFSNWKHAMEVLVLPAPV